MRWTLVLITFILLLAWPFRWEKGPVMNKDGLTVIHKNDRWTGQSWVELYGNVGDEFVSKEERPIPKQQDIDILQTKLLSELKIKVENQLNREKTEMAKFQQGEDKYIELRNNIEPKVTETLFGKSGWSKDENGKDVLNPAGGWFFNPQQKKLVDDKVNSLIPSNVLQQHQNFTQAKSQVDKYENELRGLSNQANKLALSELSNKAYTQRKFATVIWGFGVIVALLVLILNLCYKKRSME